MKILISRNWFEPPVPIVLHEGFIHNQFSGFGCPCGSCDKGYYFKEGAD